MRARPSDDSASLRRRSKPNAKATRSEVRSTRSPTRWRSDVEISASLLSYHLKQLREAGLVQATRRGKWIDYTLAADAHDRLAAALPTVGR